MQNDQNLPKTKQKATFYNMLNIVGEPVSRYWVRWLCWQASYIASQIEGAKGGRVRQTKKEGRV